MPQANKKENPNQKLFFFARDPENVYEEEALRGVYQIHRQALELALRDFRDSKVILDEWLDWLLEDDPQHPLSFRSCCEEVGYNPEVIRTRTATYIYHYGNLTEDQKKKIETEVF